jgi:myo-inositol-1(or 4)-monophosphatase
MEPPADPQRWGRKGTSDFVTDVDRTAVALIAEVLEEETPKATIVGEELSSETAVRGLVWIVDPLDGTTNFLHRYPMYAVSVAAAVDGILQAGVVLDIPHDHCYRAALGHGATLGDTRLSVSDLTDPTAALIGTGFPFKRPEWLPMYTRQFSGILTGTSGVRRTGSAALDLAAVAAGRYDGFWELALAPWDIAAGVLLVTEAGGTVSDLAGRPVGLGHTPVIAGNAAMHAWLLAQLEADGSLLQQPAGPENHP